MKQPTINDLKCIAQSLMKLHNANETDHEQTDLEALIYDQYENLTAVIIELEQGKKLKTKAFVTAYETLEHELETTTFTFANFYIL